MKERTSVQVRELQDRLYELYSELEETNKLAADVAWFAAQDLDAIQVYDKMDADEFDELDKKEKWKPMEFLTDESRWRLPQWARLK